MTEKKRIAINKEVFDLPLSTHLVRSTQIRIAIVLIMCGGFGDIIAGTKLLLYLRRWYPRAAVRVVTTTPRIFEKMGVPRAHLAPVRNRRDANQQCLMQTHDEHRLNRTQLGPPANFRRPDLILPSWIAKQPKKACGARGRRPRGPRCGRCSRTARRATPTLWRI